MAGEPIAPAASVILRPKTRSRRRTGLELDPDGPLALEEDAADEALGPDGEVGPLTGRQQVGDRGGEPQAAASVLRERADARGLWMVVVGDLGEAETPADVEEGALGRNQLVSAPATDRDRATTPVELIRPFRVVLEATKMRQHPRPTPGIVAQRRPLVVVRRRAAQRDRGIDSRRAADHPAPRIGNRPPRHGLGGQFPVVLAQRHPPAVAEVVRGRLERCVVRTRLQQQDAARRILRQPSREDRPGGTATHDDVVVRHPARVLLRWTLAHRLARCPSLPTPRSSSASRPCTPRIAVSRVSPRDRRASARAVVGVVAAARASRGPSAVRPGGCRCRRVQRPGARAPARGGGLTRSSLGAAPLTSGRVRTWAGDSKRRAGRRRGVVIPAAGTRAAPPGRGRDRCVICCRGFTCRCR